MKDTLTFILKNITTHPDDLQVEEKIENGVKHLIITTHPEDTGRVIGKEGKIIKAIRTIMRVAAIQRAERVRVSIVSENNKPDNEFEVKESEIELTSDEQTENSPHSVSQESVEKVKVVEDQIDLSI